jgi:hypothetical protein
MTCLKLKIHMKSVRNICQYVVELVKLTPPSLIYLTM